MSTLFASGCTVPIDDLRAAADDRRIPDAVAAPSASPSAAAPIATCQPSLHAETERLEQAFDAGLRSREVRAAVGAILELEQAIVDWSADTEELDGVERPRATLRRMVTRLGEVAAAGTRDPRELVSPFVDALVELRNRARDEGSWTLADDLRSRLVAAGIAVHDTPEDTVWLLADRRSGP